MELPELEPPWCPPLLLGTEQPLSSCHPWGKQALFDGSRPPLLLTRCYLQYLLNERLSSLLCSATPAPLCIRRSSCPFGIWETPWEQQIPLCCIISMFLFPGTGRSPISSSVLLRDVLWYKYLWVKAELYNHFVSWFWYHQSNQNTALILRSYSWFYCR